jgi:hypothetical protein
VIAGHVAPWRRTRGIVQDVFLTLLAVLFVPIVILLMGTPIALCVRLAIAIGRRW